MPVRSFTIGNILFEDTEDKPELAMTAHGIFRERIERATFVWRRQDWEECDSGETLMFALTRQNDLSKGVFAVWVMYGILPVDGDPNLVSCRVGPMFPEIDARIPVQAFHDGQLLNGDEIAAAEERSAAFWSETFRIMEYMLDHPLERYESGTGVALPDLVIDHWSGPTEEDGYPVQHEWSDIQQHFDSHANKESDFDSHKGLSRFRRMRQDPKPTPPRVDDT